LGYANSVAGYRFAEKGPGGWGEAINDTVTRPERLKDEKRGCGHVLMFRRIPRCCVRVGESPLRTCLEKSGANQKKTAWKGGVGRDRRVKLRTKMTECDSRCIDKTSKGFLGSHKREKTPKGKRHRRGGGGGGGGGWGGGGGGGDEAKGGFEGEARFSCRAAQSPPVIVRRLYG